MRCWRSIKRGKHKPGEAPVPPVMRDIVRDYFTSLE